ncbi:MAG: hypothetical protein ACTS2F_22330 [Thainema sp.]
MNTRKKDTWTTRRLLGLGERLAAGYGFNCDRNEAQRRDSWTAEKLINMSHDFAQAYGADLDK